MNFDIEEKEQEEKDNHERWLISYADFLTLLFTFFVALYALSVLDTKKAEDFSESLNRAFRIIDSPIKNVIMERPAILDRLQLLEKKFEGVEIREIPRGILIRLPDSLLFKSGEYELDSKAKEVLNVLLENIRLISNKISIEGHTDNVPISNNFIRSNWDLASLRALSVLYYFKNSGIPPDRLSATAYGEYYPVADNNTEEGRAKNRRVEIVILR